MIRIEKAYQKKKIECEGAMANCQFRVARRSSFRDEADPLIRYNEELRGINTVATSGWSQDFTMPNGVEQGYLDIRIRGCVKKRRGLGYCMGQGTAF